MENMKQKKKKSQIVSAKSRLLPWETEDEFCQNFPRSRSHRHDYHISLYQTYGYWCPTGMFNSLHFWVSCVYRPRKYLPASWCAVDLRRDSVSMKWGQWFITWTISTMNRTRDPSYKMKDRNPEALGYNLSY
jgi:hypothetical protein